MGKKRKKLKEPGKGSAPVLVPELKKLLDLKNDKDFGSRLFPMESSEDLRKRIFQLPVLDRIERVTEEIESLIRNMQNSNMGIGDLVVWNNTYGLVLKTKLELLSFWEGLLKYSIAHVKLTDEVSFNKQVVDNELTIVVRDGPEKGELAFSDLENYEVTG